MACAEGKELACTSVVKAANNPGTERRTLGRGKMEMSTG